MAGAAMTGGSAEAGLAALKKAMGEDSAEDQPLEVEEQVEEQVEAAEAEAVDDFDPQEVAAELAAELATEEATAAPGDAWKGEAKGKLIAQGYTAKEAHFMAYKMSREKVENLLAPEPSSVQSGTATPEGAPAGSAPSGLLELSESLRDQLDGPAAEELGKILSSIQEQALAQSAATADATAQELAFLRSRVMSEDVASAKEDLVTASRELSGAYPELRNQAQWEELKPQIKAAMPLANGKHSEALRLACIAKYGVRDGQTATSPVDPSPSPAKRENPGAGSRAITASSAKTKIASMIYGGRSGDEVMKFAGQTRKRLA